MYACVPAIVRAVVRDCASEKDRKAIYIKKSEAQKIKLNETHACELQDSACEILYLTGKRNKKEKQKNLLAIRYDT